MAHQNSVSVANTTRSITPPRWEWDACPSRTTLLGRENQVGLSVLLKDEKQNVTQPIFEPEPPDPKSSALYHYITAENPEI
jgi:hypothetical protein